MERTLFIQMSGAPGAGKSTIAKMLAQLVHAEIVDHDLIKSKLLSDGIPFEEAATFTYNQQWIEAEQIIQRGRSVFVDSTCNFQETLDTGFAIAKKHGCIYRYVECSVDDIDILEQRLQERVPMRSQRRGVNEPALDAPCPGGGYGAQYKQWMNSPCRPATGVIIVNSFQSPKKCVENIFQHLCCDGLV